MLRGGNWGSSSRALRSAVAGSSLAPATQDAPETGLSVVRVSRTYGRFAAADFRGRPVTMFGKMAVEVVGRGEELDSLCAFLDRRAPAEGPTAFVLDAEAGIGKSTLWLAAVEAARERGLRVLSARPAEAERGFAYAALGDLFDDVLGEVAPALTAPQRRALEVALLVDGSGLVRPGLPQSSRPRRIRRRPAASRCPRPARSRSEDAHADERPNHIQRDADVERGRPHGRARTRSMGNPRERKRDPGVATAAAG